MKKNHGLFFGFAVIAAIFSFSLAGCGEAGDPSFVSTTDTSIAANDARLGLTAASTSSDNESVAVAEIASGKVKITSKSPGSAVITALDNQYNKAKIEVTVDDTGAITIGTITKYDAANSQFAAETKTVANTAAELGLVGTTVTVSPAGKVTAAITGENVTITITSIQGQTGEATVTVTDSSGRHSATITVIVASDGSFVKFEVAKYSVTPAGKTIYSDSGDVNKIVLSPVSSGTSGTFEGYEGWWDNSTYTYTKTREGTWSWNESAKTITFTLVKYAQQQGHGVYGPLQTKDEIIQGQGQQMPGRDANPTLAQLNSLSGGSFASTAAFYAYMSQMLGQTVTTWQQVYDLYIVPMMEEFTARFDPTTSEYLVTGDNSLLVRDPLPASKGSNPLSGGYNGMVWQGQGDQGSYVKDTNKVYTFTGTSYTFTDSTPNNDWRREEPHQGTYAWNATQRTVYLRPATVDGKDISAYYDALLAQGQSGDSSRYPTSKDYCAARTNGAFAVQENRYNTSEKTIIGWN